MMRALPVKRDSEIARRAFPFELLHSKGPANNMSAFHWHDFMELSYVTAGSGVYEIEDKVFPVTKGDIVIINNVERHRVTYGAEDPLHEIVFHFSPRLIWSQEKASFDHRYLKLFLYEGASFSNIPRLGASTQKAVARLVMDIRNEYEHRPLGYELMIKSKLLTVITHLIRESGLREEQPDGSSGARRQNIARLEEILSYMRENTTARINLRETATRFSMNPSYFSDYFHQNLGVTFTEHLIALRIQEAIRLITEGRMSSTEIVYACGFNTAASFYRAFRRQTGTNPSEYRSRKLEATRAAKK